MKVLPVSLFSFKSKIHQHNYDSEFLYYADRPEYKDYTNQYALVTALTAVTAVVITLFNISRKHKLPENIVEIANKNKGLNKIKDQERLVEILKTKFIYPIQASVSGDKKIRHSKDFNAGVIISGADKSKLSAISRALAEHFEELGFNVVEFKTTSSRVKKDGSVHTRSLKKNEIIKKFLTTVNNASTKYNSEGKYVILNIGDIDKLTKFQVAKSEKSTVDEILEGLNDKKYKGVMWIGYTSKGKAIPLSFNDLPILMTKLS